MRVTDRIIEIDSGKPGPTVMILAGVHGNEKAGVYALQELLPKLKIKKGKVYAAFANPPAIEADVRMLTKNLNRCFYEGNDGREWEDIRAREIMEYMDKCDALLDLHMFYDEKGVPFAICEENALNIASKFDLDIISTNWTATEPGGTDGYMYLKGKVGICVECGPISKAKNYVEFAKKTIYQFLQYFDMSLVAVKYSSKIKKVVRTEKTVYKTSDNFVLQPELSNFQSLEKGQILAADSKQEYLAESGDILIFPHYSARVGEEVYLIGRDTPMWS